MAAQPRVVPRASSDVSMFFRMLVRAAVLRRGRAASALFAMVVAATVATAMLNLYVDVQAKLRREFRNYGANIVLVSRDGSSLPADALTQAESVLAGRGVAAPFALVVARTSDGQPIVVVGADFDRVQQLDGWWSVTLGLQLRSRRWLGCARFLWCLLRASLSISAFRDTPFT